MKNTMLPILTAAQMKACDEYTIATLGIPSRTLMERAARRTAEVFVARTDVFPVGRVAVLCGGGNNGGDGFAVARFLTDGSLGEMREAVILYAGRLTDTGTPDPTRMSVECRRQYELAVEAGIAVQTLADAEAVLADAVAVVDAVFGIGLDRPVEGDLAHLIRRVAQSALPCLAVDIPSGIHADTGKELGTALPAKLTVTMQALKAGLLLYPGADFCGELVVADLGIDLTPAEAPFAHLADESLLRRVLPPRARRSHKGTYGRVALLCGSEGMSGAAVLATCAALRSGAGLAEVLTPEVNRTVLQTTIPEAIVTVRDSVQTLEATTRKADGLVVGCGLGTSDTSREALRAVMNALPKPHGFIPVVADADGLNLMAQDPTLWAPLNASHDRQVVLTPHPAEMSRLCGKPISAILADPTGVALDFARTWGVTVVLKDAHTVIASPDGQLYLCPAGNAGLAKGGSGDVLAGIIGALLTQNRDRLGKDLTAAEVAAAGVWLHARAADLAAERLGEYGMLASDVIQHIPLVCKDFSDSKTRISRVGGNYK